MRGFGVYLFALGVYVCVIVLAIISVNKTRAGRRLVKIHERSSRFSDILRGGIV